jgi:hypothetical protein
MTEMLPFTKPSSLPARKAEKTFGNVENGRYWLPDVEDPQAWIPGSHGAKPFPRGYMRMTNLIGAYAELRALMIWEEHRILEGIAARPDLYARLCVMPRDEEGMLSHADGRSIVDEALRAAKADQWAVFGTAYHTALETRLTTGRLVGTPEIKEAILALEHLLKTHLLATEPSLAERIVVNRALKAAGRFDVPVWDEDGILRMGDLKSKKKQFFTHLELRAQLAGYAHADAMWDQDAKCYVPMPPFAKDWGVIYHLPQGGGEAKLLKVDLEKGWRTCLRAREVVDDRAEAKSIPMLREAEMVPPALDTMSRVALRLSMVETLEEGSAVVATIPEALYGPELDEQVTNCIERLTGFRPARQLTS